MRIVQLYHPDFGRRLARVDDSRLEVFSDFPSLHALATEADRQDAPIAEIAGATAVEQTLAYDPIYAGESPWRLLPAFDHPSEPARCLVSGTGLTHTGSANSRNAMHAQATAAEPETDSMKMFRWGLDGGKPAASAVGTAPEWFYKGNGLVLRGPGEPLEIPSFAESGGEESEIVGLYFVGRDATPRRVGYATGNEFSDHAFEKRNYLYLAHSKLRTCSLGPEARIGEELPDHIAGHVAIERAGRVIWERALESGEACMCHSLRNIEHHHFKHAGHCRPGDVHVHFFGAAALSYSAGVRLASEDSVAIAWDGFGRPLRNPVIRLAGDPATPIAIRPL